MNFLFCLKEKKIINCTDGLYKKIIRVALGLQFVHIFAFFASVVSE